MTSLADGMSCRRRQAPSAAATEYANNLYRARTLLCHHERGWPATVRAYCWRSTCRPIEPAHILQFPSAPKCIAKKTARARNYDAVRVGIKSCGLSRGSSLTLAPIMPTRTPCEGRSVARLRKPAALWWRWCAGSRAYLRDVCVCLADAAEEPYGARTTQGCAEPKSAKPVDIAIGPATFLVII